MKMILNISIAGMIAAGIYGFADFSKDLYKGTLIKYDDGEVAVKKESPVVIVKGTKTEKSVVKKMESESTTKQVAHKKEAAPVEEKKEESSIDLSKVKLRYFSRGRPPVIVDDVLNPDVNVNAIVTPSDSVKKDKASDQ